MTWTTVFYLFFINDRLEYACYDSHIHFGFSILSYDNDLFFWDDEVTYSYK